MAGSNSASSLSSINYLEKCCKPGKPERFDYEYERRGTANVFMLVAPRLGWRQVNVTGRRTRVDFALQMRLLVDNYFPQAPAICQSPVEHRPLRYFRECIVPTWGRPTIWLGR